MEDQVYNWLVGKGSIMIQKNGDRISLQLDYGDSDYCVLTYSDANEIIEILTGIAKQIWESPSYEKMPYTGKLYKRNENEYYWEIGNSKLIIDEGEEGIEIRYAGTSKLDLEVNYVVEIVQVMDHLNS